MRCMACSPSRRNDPRACLCRVGRAPGAGLISRMAVAVVAAAMLPGCGSDNLVSANGGPDRTLSLAVGQELALTFQSIGPGEYASPPAISSPAVEFRDVALVTPAVPAGVTQRFRFRAVAPGQAVIRFEHTGQGPAVEDTVDVQ